MEVFGIGFLVAISVIGGVIAVLADNLGRTLGKKRLTLLRLRPRRTAQVMTFMAGAMIPLLTVGAVALLSADVRRWFAEGPRVIAERDRLSGEVGGLRSDLSELEQQRSDLGQEIAGLQKSAAELQDKLKKSESDLVASQARLAEASAKLASLDRQYATLQKEYGATKKNLAETQVKLATATREVRETERQRDSVQQSFDTLTEMRDQAERRVIDLQNEVAALEEDKARLEADKVRIETQLASTAKELAETRTSLSSQQQSLERTRIDLDETVARLRDAQRAYDLIANIAGNARVQPLTFRLGEELARVQAPKEMSRTDARNHLNRLLRAARTEAERRGAQPKGSIQAAEIMDRFDENGRPISSELQAERISERLSGLSDEVVLIASAELNAFAGEPVPVVVQSFRNPVVFRQGDLVAEARIDGDRPEQAILDQITAFATQDVRKKAQESGMIPILGVESGYGVLSMETVLELIRTARAFDRRARIQALASKDIRAGDPLELNYRIR